MTIMTNDKRPASPEIVCLDDVPPAKRQTTGSNNVLRLVVVNKRSLVGLLLSKTDSNRFEETRNNLTDQAQAVFRVAAPSL